MCIHRKKALINQMKTISVSYSKNWNLSCVVISHYNSQRNSSYFTEKHSICHYLVRKSSAAFINTSYVFLLFSYGTLWTAVFEIQLFYLTRFAPLLLCFQFYCSNVAIYFVKIKMGGRADTNHISSGM